MLPILSNFSPFPSDIAAVLDPHARQYFVVVLGATFEVPPGAVIGIAEEQAKLTDVDVHFGAHAMSSTRYEADNAPEKPGSDIVVNGSARAPRGNPVSQLRIGIRVEGVLEKTLLVSGDRFWRRSVLGIAPSTPEPFVAIPVVYERAYGGSTSDSVDQRNPVGIGYSGAKSSDPDVRSEVPNVEYQDALMKAPDDKRAPAGFGFIARGWSPRLELAGTYDEKWKAEQFPLLPLDFDPRFHLAAPVDQQVSEIRGGEIVHVFNMTPSGHWSFVVPRLRVPLRLRYSDRVQDADLKLDTVVIEPDFHRLTLKARTKVAVRRNVSPLQEVVVGHAPTGWWRARMSSKEYLDASRRSVMSDQQAYFTT